MSAVDEKFLPRQVFGSVKLREAVTFKRGFRLCSAGEVNEKVPILTTSHTTRTCESTCRIECDPSFFELISKWGPAPVIMFTLGKRILLTRCRRGGRRVFEGPKTLTV